MGCENSRCELEVWKPIPGYECFYEASSLGRVRSLDRQIRTKSGSRNCFRSGKVLVGKLLWDGYHSVLLTVDGVQKHFKTHRLVLSAFDGLRPDGYEARHLNGNRTDNRIDNLCWGTPAQNLEDKRAHGMVLAGERHPRWGKGVDGKKAKELEASGLTRSEIASRLKCSPGRITQVLGRKT